jgi:cation diffusion facilitator family transporter
MNGTPKRRKTDRALHTNWFAMRLSLVFGLLMLAGKVAAYVVTGSAAILSDAVESVVHVVAVVFAAVSLRLSARPADLKFPWGYERIAFFSAGFEGAMIILAALSIIAAAVQKIIVGVELERLGTGMLLVALAALINAALGVYLVRTGRRTRSLILEANGKHVLTDSWTSAGVIGGLLLVVWTGWTILDPLVAIVVALNILWSGGRLVGRSIGGLMDYVEPQTRELLCEAVEILSSEFDVGYHGLRMRHTGNRLIIDVHLLFPIDIPLSEAHRIATGFEKRLAEQFDEPVEVITHLEALEDHGEVHRRAHDPIVE